MSIYSQSYPGHPPYGAASYTHPPLQSGYPYPYLHSNVAAPPPPPQPVYHYLDPASFRREFTTRLSELQVNSRPLIQNLSMLAQDYSKFAEIVAQCIEEHIRRVPPWMKLPAFYLLDAISKNVYEPYARHFASFVKPLFLETYGQVDEATRTKMEEMLLTWRTGSPAGKELFAVPPQIAIERGIWGDSAANYNSFSLSGRVTKAQVLSELEYTLGQKERALQANPYDTTSQNHVNVLYQLRKLVDAGVSQEELQQILNQLRTLIRQVPQPPTSSSSSNPTWPSQMTLPGSLSSTSYPPSSSAPTSGQPHQQHVIPPHAVKAEVGIFNPNAAAPQLAASKDNIASLLSTLVKAGVVSASTSVTPDNTKASAKVDDQDTQRADLEREFSRYYRNSILAQKIQLNSLDIMRKRPNVVNLLYDQLSLQCKQCGLRFADTVVGKKRMEEHLDMHFRQNRKATQNVGRGHSRSWFTSAEDWSHDLPPDVKGKGRENNTRSFNARVAAEEVAKREAELRAQYVVVSPGDEAKALSCPICKEQLKTEFLEEDEEWVWKNATKKDDRVYHATCFAEATAVKSSFAARLRFEKHGSRSGTPDTQSSRTTPPPDSRISRSKSPISPPRESKVVGTKRKVQSDDIAFGGNATPPFKKAALCS
ncbi:hypothetical protein M378DRAFT_158585 [Amanita muscaria Koide BX008]|uniref:CID domain-containing protein n=1 Tax=Amanita muscaria (strain Koide BX008) TaxID=946122 RepID=A0A0C2TLT4_AMAMK|nr:hypothetical protein M378DRAFT_158585 [Amanita muscaria Koide BX008]